MNLRILLPFKIFAELQNVKRIVVETIEGSFGMLPQRLDCVAAVVPGIFTYELEGESAKYIAVDAGILVKAGTQIFLSVRNAIGGADLGKLGEIVKEQFSVKNDRERQAQSVMDKLESS